MPQVYNPAVMDQRPIYLDHAATTPVRPEAHAAMEPFLAERFGNPSSTHGPGRDARGALEEARERVAAVLGAEPDEIVFTGGGTESDNLAILGRWRAHRRGGSEGAAAEAGAVVVSAVEHSAVRESAAQAAREGAAVGVVAVDETGRLDLHALDELIEPSCAVVSLMWGNNEVGALQPVDEAAALCRERGVIFHTDAVQAVGHVRVSVREVPCDLLSLSAHKFGGPRGIGALFVRRGVQLEPVLHGGGQERGLRAGTSNVAGAVGLAEALERAVAELDAKGPSLRAMRDRLERVLVERLDGIEVHGAGAPRLPHVLSIGIDGVSPDMLLPALDMAGLSVSAGSACQSGSTGPSPVLVAMGRSHDAAVRFSLGWTTTMEEVDRAAALFLEVAERSRSAVGAT